MCDVLSFTEVNGQYVELLPARTVLSMFSTATDPSSGGSGGSSSGDPISQVMGPLLSGVMPKPL
jgi:hypothetical protein